VGCVTGRQRPSLSSPPTDPVTIPSIARPAHAWRAHTLRPDPSKGAWWFSHSPDGRFDLEAPRGTCYLASDAQTALRERLGPTLAGLSSVEAADVDGVAVSLLPVPRGPDLADTLNAAAVRIPGLTREICTSVDYALTRSWAAYFDARGCGGVRYSARHTTALNSLSYAVFGKQGTRASRPRQTLSAREVATQAGLHIATDAVPDHDVEIIDVP